MTDPEVGASARAELVVRQEDCASDLRLNNAPNENFPAVFATARMIALMEMAGARLPPRVGILAHVEFLARLTTSR